MGAAFSSLAQLIHPMDEFIWPLARARAFASLTCSTTSSHECDFAISSNKLQELLPSLDLGRACSVVDIFSRHPKTNLMPTMPFLFIIIALSDGDIDQKLEAIFSTCVQAFHGDGSLSYDELHALLLSALEGLLAAYSLQINEQVQVDYILQRVSSLAFYWNKVNLSHKLNRNHFVAWATKRFESVHMNNEVGQQQIGHMIRCLFGVDITNIKQVLPRSEWLKFNLDDKERRGRLEKYLLSKRRVDLATNSGLLEGTAGGVKDQINDDSLLISTVHGIWEEATKYGKTEVGAAGCWALILASEELTRLVGNGDTHKGEVMLLAMKDAEALGQIGPDGPISSDMFRRLYDPQVLAAAASAADAAYGAHVMDGEGIRSEELDLALAVLADDFSRLGSLEAQLDPLHIEYIQSDAFATDAGERFSVLSKGKSALEALDLLPVICSLVGNTAKNLTNDQLSRFLSLFDISNSGTLDVTEFKLLMRFSHALALNAETVDEEEIHVPAITGNENAESASQQVLQEEEAAEFKQPSKAFESPVDNEVSDLKGIVGGMAQALAAEHETKEMVALELEQTRNELQNTTLAMHQMRRDFDALMVQLMDFANKSDGDEGDGMPPRRMKSLAARLTRVITQDDTESEVAAEQKQSRIMDPQSPVPREYTGRSPSLEDGSEPISPTLVRNGKFETGKPTHLWDAADMLDHVRAMGPEFKVAADLLMPLELDGKRLLAMENESLPALILSAGIPDELQARLLVELRVLKGVL